MPCLLLWIIAERVKNNEKENQTCNFRPYFPTSDDPLHASSPFTVHLSLPIKKAPQELQINVIRVTDDDKIKTYSNGSFMWLPKGENMQQGNYSTLAPERESDINLSLEPGLYVLEVYPRWKEEGSVSYGFLVNVR